MQNIDAQHDEVALPVVEHLPIWWRCILIAVAMVILNACAEPVTRTHLSPDKSLAQPPRCGSDHGADCSGGARADGSGGVGDGRAE